MALTGSPINELLGMLECTGIGNANVLLSFLIKTSSLLAALVELDKTYSKVVFSLSTHSPSMSASG